MKYVDKRKLKDLKKLKMEQFEIKENTFYATYSTPGYKVRDQLIYSLKNVLIIK